MIDEVQEPAYWQTILLCPWFCPVRTFYPWRGGVVDADSVTGNFSILVFALAQKSEFDANGRFRYHHGFVADSLPPLNR